MTGTECYSYARERLQKEEAKRKEKKEEKKRKAAEKEKRRKRLSQIGNDRIRTLIYDEYMSLYSAYLSRLKEESRVNKLERIRKALLNIDFVSGEINSDYYWGRFKEIVYLTNKNVLVFNGIEHDAYIYLPWQKETKLSVISHESMRTYWFDFLQEIYRSNPACILDSDARALSSRIPDQDILPLLPQLRRAAVCRKRDDEYFELYDGACLN